MNPEPQRPQRKIPVRVWLLALALAVGLIVATVVAYLVTHQAIDAVQKPIKLNIPF